MVYPFTDQTYLGIFNREQYFTGLFKSSCSVFIFPI
jgi:hypothetical protein